jgi:HD-GYP domain-containing protein (c-di-GMP phosphodiesterase class II)
MCRMSEGLRLAELIAALSLATDLGVGQPLEQALRTCLIALALCDRLGLSEEERSEVYYVALLRFVGCTADASEMAQLAGGDEIALRAAIAPVAGGSPREFASDVLPTLGAGQGPLRRARLVATMMRSGRDVAREGLRAHCELGEHLAVRLGLPVGVRASLGAAFEQWNGAGMPNGISGEDIPLSARIVVLARDVEILHRLGGNERVLAAVSERAGGAYDPALADTLLTHSAEALDVSQTSSPWEDVLAREPQERPWVPKARLDDALSAFGDFVDLKSPFTAGHSRGVAALVSEMPTSDGVALRRAALVHDLGRAAVPNGIWDKPGPLTDGEWERVRLHPYYTERIIARVQALKPLATVAGMHHERLDGSGYHRGSSRTELPDPARILAAADAYQAMTQHRPHRPALSADQAADELQSMARSGQLDRKAVDTVLTAAGHQPSRSRSSWPAELTDREVEVLRLICRGNTKKQVARELVISPSTVDHHVRHIYQKAGVQTRAGATLFALEHDLLK